MKGRPGAAAKHGFEMASNLRNLNIVCVWGGGGLDGKQHPRPHTLHAGQKQWCNRQCVLDGLPEDMVDAMMFLSHSKKTTTF